MGPNLRKYIALQNKTFSFWAGMGQPIGKEYDPNNLSEDDKRKLADRLSSDLSPEALTCDGEIRGAKLLAKSKFLNAVKKEMEEMGLVVEMY